MKKLLIIPLCLIVSLIAAQPAEVNIDNTKSDQLEDLMAHCHKNGMFNGTILVADDGEVIFKRAFGYAEKEKRKLNSKSVFYLASVSKQFTTMAIMILKEEGKLNYENTLNEYFPEFPDYARNVTIHHLMTHTSGIPDHFRLGAYKPDLTNREVLEQLTKQDTLDFEPGSTYSYSNGGYVLLSLIVEKASGQPFHSFMKDKIFNPLKMNSTLVYDESKPKIENRALGYNQSGGLDDYDILTTGAGGMFSNVEDLYKWDRSLYTEKIISAESLEEAYTTISLSNGETSNYGYGWAISEEDGNKVVSHGGSLSGYRTFIKRFLDTKSSYIILSNNGNAIAAEEIRDGIENILANKPYELPKIPYSMLLAKRLNDADPEKALKEVNEILTSKPDTYRNDEMGINSLGYSYMGEEDYSTAIKVFQMNTEINPSSSNVWDSLGEGYMMAGDTAQAIKNYLKSIELNPNNQHGKNMLEKMGYTEAFNDYMVPVDIMDSYVGDYELMPNFILAISREENQMYIFPTGQIKSPIYAASENRFYSKLVNAQITFNKDDQGNVVSLTLHQGGDHLAKKIN